MSQATFRPHGDYNVVLNEGILYIQVKGEGNVEIVRQYQREFKQIFASRMHDPYCAMLTLTEAGLLTREAAERFTLLLKSDLNKNRITTAFVFEKERMEFPQLVESFWLGLYRNAGLETTSFSSIDDARAYLNARLEKGV